MRFALFLILLMLIQITSANEVYSEDFTVEKDSYYEIEFTVLQNSTLNITIVVSELLTFLILDEGNFSAWKEQSSIIPIHSRLLNKSSYDFSLEFTDVISSITLFSVFVNTFNISSSVNFTMDLFTIHTDNASYSFFFILPLLLIRRKQE